MARSEWAGPKPGLKGGLTLAMSWPLSRASQFNSSREVGIGEPAWARQNTGFKPGTRNLARGLMASLVVDSNQTVSEHKCFTVSLHF